MVGIKYKIWNSKDPKQKNDFQYCFFYNFTNDAFFWKMIKSIKNLISLDLKDKTDPKKVLKKSKITFHDKVWEYEKFNLSASKKDIFLFEKPNNAGLWELDLSKLILCKCYYFENPFFLRR